jgi:hypothetical protein
MSHHSLPRCGGLSLCIASSAKSFPSQDNSHSRPPFPHRLLLLDTASTLSQHDHYHDRNWHIPYQSVGNCQHLLAVPVDSMLSGDFGSESFALYIWLHLD